MFFPKFSIYIFFFKFCSCYDEYVFSEIDYQYRDSNLFLRVNLSNYLQGIPSPCIDYEFKEHVFDIEFWIHDYYDGFNDDSEGTYCFLKDSGHGKKFNMNVRTYKGEKIIWNIDIIEPYGTPSRIRNLHFDKEDYLDWNTPKKKRSEPSVWYKSKL